MPSVERLDAKPRSFDDGRAASERVDERIGERVGDVGRWAIRAAASAHDAGARCANAASSRGRCDTG
ncbi:hypothetical protein NX868_21520 [Burkholderia thailandensis]|uniref:hypothetical protein n=1 Tax=Burkholderia thailandensis TaxID=57975 RepID=UPI0009B67CE2|nr:hypothetical protein [Burkholderia thailandensis]MCS3394005.1 hypothetical protein [Burkholderia thailandensis]MCS6426947.1 hypothetical protein [Burkholderia thailandensis]MCS6455378.1 hypothetical protein [Burkholderia thailandensis]MCS6465971.1 hypothetical protein [Burkholderia thailandensis]MCS6484842.1 hypothetical protein [Burkholderia thailandensis]